MVSTSYLNYNDPLLITWRKGTADDPYVTKSDTLKILNGKIILTEIPDDFTHVTINGFVEVKAAPIAGQFQVNYTNGVVMFDGADEGKTVTAAYMGKGIIQYPAERVYNHKVFPFDIVDNVQKLIDQTATVVGFAAKFNGVTATGGHTHDGTDGMGPKLDPTVALTYTPVNKAGDTMTGALTATRFVSNVATGTSPLQVTSTTAVSNLNADMLDGYHSTAFALLAGAAFTGAVSGTTLTISGQLTSNVAQGTAPMVITSSTKVLNLNADLLDGFSSDATAAVNTVALRDANGDLTARILKSVIATGTAPFTVTSTTAVANLNADMVDGKHSTDFALLAGATFTGAVSGTTLSMSGQITSTLANGTAPFVVTSTTKVANLNADLLDGYSTDATSAANTVALRDASGDLSTRVLKSTVATGTAPLTVTSTTAVTNLNADMLDGAHLTALGQLAAANTWTAVNTFNGLINVAAANSQTTVGAAGTAATLPTAPVGYIKLQVGATTYAVPYFNA